MQQGPVEGLALRELLLERADNPIVQARVVGPVAVTEFDRAEPRLLLDHPVNRLADHSVGVILPFGTGRQRRIAFRLLLLHIRLVEVENRIVAYDGNDLVLFAGLLRKLAILLEVDLAAGLFVADTDFPEVDRERQGALEDIQPLLLGLPEGHEDWRLIARYSRKEEQHQDIPGPVGRAAQVAGKTVREVRDPRFLPVGFEVFDTLDHQLRQSGCYGIYQILVFHGWMGLETGWK